MNIAQICPVTCTLGPGRRFALWVQGCPFSCKGCVSPDWIEQRAANRATPENLARYIVKTAFTEGLEGITLSGGEPMLQARGLSILIDQVHSELPDFSVIAFSGFTLRQLRSRRSDQKAITDLLARLDVLIDGQYVESNNDAVGLRGSRNQRVHFLTSRYKHLYDTFNFGARAIEVHLLKEDALMVGVPTPRMLADFSLLGGNEPDRK